MITIVDYGMGNLGSIYNMFKRLGINAEIGNTIESLNAAKKLLLPGVGAFDAAVSRIHDQGFWNVLNRKVVEEKTPLLGICLGMQLLTESSEEGALKGFGWIEGKTIKFKFDAGSRLKVPHMGWNNIHIRRENLLTMNLPEEPRFYFVHSYYVTATDRENSLCTTEHGVEFDSVVGKDNIYGAQFHPEKSHRYGMKIFENFARL